MRLTPDDICENPFCFRPVRTVLTGVDEDGNDTDQEPISVCLVCEQVLLKQILQIREDMGLEEQPITRIGPDGVSTY